LSHSVRLSVLQFCVRAASRVERLRGCPDFHLRLSSLASIPPEHLFPRVWKQAPAFLALKCRRDYLVVKAIRLVFVVMQGDLGGGAPDWPL
jgi:hypothetical protein